MRGDYEAINVWAERGLQRLSGADFRKDWQLVTGEDSACREVLEHAAAALRDLPDEKVEALAAVLNKETSQFVRDSVLSLRAGRGKPLGDVLAPALNNYWNSFLRARVVVELRKLTGSRGRAVLSPDQPAGSKPTRF